jgi:hypothetical protein
MKHLLLLLFVLLSSALFAQIKGWKQLSGPYGDATAQVEIAETGKIYVLAGSYVTTFSKLFYRDSNNSWLLSSLPYAADFQVSYLATEKGGAIFYFNTGNLNLKTQTGIYRSIDDGKTWTKVLSTFFISTIRQSSSSGNLYAFQGGQNISYTAIFRSTNHGATWDSLSSIPLKSTNYLVDNNDQCYFSLQGSPEVGLVRYNPKTNLYTAVTTNITASKANTSFITFCRGSLYLRSDSSLFIMKPNDVLEQIMALPSPCYTFFSTGSGNLYTTTASGQYWTSFRMQVSSDLGKTWKDFDPGLKNMIVSGDYSYIPYIGMASDSAGKEYFAERFYGLPSLYRSTDQGNSWKTFGLPASQIRRIQEAPGNILYVEDFRSSPGNNGNTYYYPLAGYASSNGGATWEDPSVFYPSLGWYTGSFVKTSDGGFLYFKDSGYTVPQIYYADKSNPNTFEIQSSVFNAYAAPSVFGTFSNRTYALLNGDLMWTTDNGITWEALTIPITGPGLSTFSIDAMGAIYIGYGPAIYRSVDTGITWTKIITPIKNAYISTIKFASPSIIIVGTLGDGLWKSSDNGSSWKQWVPAIFDSISAVEIIASTCYVATSNGLISSSLTSDVWRNQLLVDEHQSISQLFRSDSGYLYASVPDMGIWTTNPNIPVFRAIRTASEGFDLKIDESFDHSQTVTFALKNYGHITLSLYDILGHKLQTISEGDFDAGQHRVPLPTSQMANGMYNVILTTDNVRAPAKLLINR